MLNARTIVLACSTCLAGCATAGDPQLVISDAPQRGDTGVDAPTPVDGPTRIDGPPAGSCASPFSGALATWDFSGGAGDESSEPSSATATGVTAGDVSRASGLTASTGAGSINSSNWSTSPSLDTTKYYTLSLTAPAGCAIDLTELDGTASRSGTGPADGAVATSADAFASTSPFTPPSTSSTISPTLSVSNVTGPLEIRIYGYDATSTSGTMRLSSTLTVTGSIH